MNSKCWNYSQYFRPFAVALHSTYELDLPCLILFYKANAILSFSHCRICVVYFDFEEGNVPISVWAVCLDPYDFVCCLCTILLHCGQHI